jgi:cobaltochelatase CobT
MSGTPQAFLSYTRLDDQAHYGGITKLRAALELQVRAVTGDDGFEIFQDVDRIALGKHWPRLLDETLAAVPFLIPVLSPRFFKSEPCRDELRSFSTMSAPAAATISSCRYISCTLPS